MDFAKQYGYTFEHEETYDRMCLVNDAVYIAKYQKAHIDKKTGKEIWWTATGTQFQVPYVFKKLFSREKIEFDDLCETKSVQTALYLDMNEDGALPFDNGTGDDEYHNYIFVGKVGRFCPIKPGHGGGLLCREATDPKTGEKKYVSATGAKGYRWKESEIVRELGSMDDIDYSYYDKLVDAAIEEISKYGDFYHFASDDRPDTPPWFNPDEPFCDETASPFDVR